MKKYLPIGSIVLLKNGTKKVMIYGRRQISVENKKVYDYVACFYPEGNINEQYNFLFDNEDIEQVVFKGFTDEDEKEFTNMLASLDEK